MKPVSFRTTRHFGKGEAPGGHVIGELAFEWLMMPVSVVEFEVGSQIVWLNRDEAIEVGTSLIDAARDA